MSIFLRLYEVTQNSDLTEGRGAQISRGYFKSEQAAYDFFLTIGGIMGTTSGKEINYVEFVDDATEEDKVVKKTKLLWGYFKGPDGKYRHGWTDGRDLPQQDPEWEEYVRLREKFKDAK